MVIASAKFNESCLPLEYSGFTIERVSSSKLLHVSVNTALRWNDHIDTIKDKISKRLYFLKQLRRAGLSSVHLLRYYETVIRPVVEDTSSLWHSSISDEQSRSLTSNERTTLRIITTGITPYKDACLEFNIQTLCNRRNFFSKILLPALSSEWVPLLH